MKGGTRKKGNKWYYYFDAGKEQKKDKNGQLLYDELGNPIYKRKGLAVILRKKLKQHFQKH